MKKPSLFRSESWHLLLMLLLSVATQCVALLKSTVTASAFGASLEMDAYNFSNNIILFLFSFLSSGVTAVIIPAYVQKKPRAAVDSFLTLLYLLVFGGTGLIYLLREPIIALFSSRGGDFQAIAGDVMLYTIVIQGVTGILAVTTAYYQDVYKRQVHDHAGNHLVVVGVDTDALVSGFGNQVQLCLHRLSGTQDDGVHALVDHVLEEVRPLGVAVINDILEGPAPHLTFQLALEDGALLALDFRLGMDAGDFQGSIGLDRRAYELVEGTGVGADVSCLAVGGGG